MNLYEAVTSLKKMFEANWVFRAADPEEVVARREIYKSWVVLDTADVRVVELESKELAIEYGKGTKWEISSPDASRNTFSRYYALGYSFYIVFNKRSGKRMVVSIPPPDADSTDIEYYSEDNTVIPEETAKQELKELGAIAL